METETQVDGEALNAFVAQARTATPAQIRLVIARLDDQIRRGERSHFRGRWIETATLRAAREALTALIA